MFAFFGYFGALKLGVKIIFVFYIHQIESHFRMWLCTPLACTDMKPVKSASFRMFAKETGEKNAFTHVIMTSTFENPLVMTPNTCEYQLFSHVVHYLHSNSNWWATTITWEKNQHIWKLARHSRLTCWMQLIMFDHTLDLADHGLFACNERLFFAHMRKKVVPRGYCSRTKWLGDWNRWRAIYLFG